MVIKIGGSELENERFLEGLGQAVANWPEVVIVHGGGPTNNKLSERLGITPRFLDGQRVTDAATLEVAVLGLTGGASTSLVAGLVRQGVKALGLSGVDAGLVKTRQVEGELGLVGMPVGVDAEGLRALTGAGFTPCLSPISLGERGQLLNVNADFVASAVAAGMGADCLVFLTGSGGILVDGQPQERLTARTCREFIESGVIGAGMIPKVESALQALEAGVARVLITNLAGLEQFRQGQPCATEVSL
ncbi:MAG: acetylglutamate kinase [Vulcanimicrobiota bacterium]